MKKLYILFLFVNIICFAQTYQPTNNILYVKKGSTGNGSSWNNAVGELADAMKWAYQNRGSWTTANPLQIYVGKGVYKPMYSPVTFANATRDNTFLLISNVKLYGGFDPDNNINDLTKTRVFGDAGTILSGDLNGNDASNIALNELPTHTTRTDNAYHVVMSAGTVGNAGGVSVLDGFTVTGGNANTYTSLTVNSNVTFRNGGGGIYVRSFSPTLNNLILKWNCGALNNVGSAPDYAEGGGIICVAASPIISNSTVNNNYAFYGGGIGILGGSSPVFKNVVVHTNGASSSIGGIDIDNSTMNISNSLIYNNSSAGIGFNGITGVVKITNTSISNNAYGLYYYTSSSSTVYTIDVNNSIIFNNNTELSSAGTSNMLKYSNSYIKGTSWNSTWGVNVSNNIVSTIDPFTNSANNNYTLSANSIAVDKGNNTLYTSIGGNLTTDKDLAGLSRSSGCSIDMGAYEVQNQFCLQPTNNILYVKKGSTGNGSSWTNAVGELADAVKWANQNKSSFTVANPLTIYVAKGTYKPMYSPLDGDNYTATPVDPRDRTFLMVENVKLYGGFDPDNGINNLSNQRVFGDNGSILSGDFNGNDVITGSGSTLNITNNTENAYHIVLAASSSSITINIDGFKITGGNADSGSQAVINGVGANRSFGSSLYAYSTSSLTNINATNIIISGNYAANGSGIASYANFTNFKISSALISRNNANNGSGLYAYSGASMLELKSTTLSGNKGNYTIFYDGSGNKNLLSYNSIIFGNNNTDLYNVVPTKDFKNSLIQSESSTANNNLDGTSSSYTTSNVFTNFATGDFSLINYSPLINNGSNSLYTSGGGNLTNDRDLANNPRLFEATIDIGAYENQTVQIAPDANNILYVNTNVTGGDGSGSSWTNAIKELADALKWANTNKANFTTTPLQIWVAKGTYKPIYRPDTFAGPNITDRNNSFLMVNNVKLYGGFDPANNISTLGDTRIFGAAGSVLSGDIGTTGTETDNTYHVVISANAVGEACLDGFYITGGYADSTDTGNIIVNTKIINQIYGGGMVNQSSILISNCSFINNLATYGGGLQSGSDSFPVINNCYFTNNKSLSGGGGFVNIENSSPTITNSYFINNTSYNQSLLGSGGGLQNDSVTGIVLLKNCMFQGNSALGSNDDGGGGIMMFYGKINVINCTFSNNITGSLTKPNANAISTMSSVSLNISNSIIWGEASEHLYNMGTQSVNYSIIKTLAEKYTGTNNINENPQFINPSIGDFSLQSTSPAIDKGNNTFYNTNGGNLITDKDLSGNTRLSECTIDMGAYEFQNPDTYVNWDGTLWSNTSGPTQSLGACINNNYNLSNSFSTKNLKVLNGSLNIKPNQSVTVYGNITQSEDNSIILENDANLIQTNDNAVNDAKKITVKRDAHMRKLDYTYWGTPVSNQKLLNDTSINDGFSVGTPNNRIYNYNEPNDYFIGATDQNFVPGKGYAIRGKDAFNDNNLTLANYQFVGGINNGIYPATVQKSKNTILNATEYEHGYNLIGNPYPSNIDFDKFFNLNTNSSKIFGKVWFWTNVAPRLNQSGSGYNGNNYATLTLTGGSPPTTTQPNSGLTPTQFIKVGQGFIVQVRDATTTTSPTVSHQLDFNNSIRTDEAGIFYNAKNGLSGKDRFWLQLVSPQQFTNTILVGYVNGATNQYDGDYDADVMSLGDDSVYTLLGSQKLQIDGRQYPLSTEDVIPLGTKYAEDGIYQLSLSTKEGIFINNQSIYIKDKLLNKVIDISQDAYNFQAVKGTDENRFEIVYKPQDFLDTNNNIENNLIVYKDEREFVVKSNEILIKVQLFDMSGKLINEISKLSKEIRISHQSLINAAYVLKVYKNGEVVTKKVIK